MVVSPSMSRGTFTGHVYVPTSCKIPDGPPGPAIMLNMSKKGSSLCTSVDHSGIQPARVDTRGPYLPGIIICLGSVLFNVPIMLGFSLCRLYFRILATLKMMLHFSKLAQSRLFCSTDARDCNKYISSRRARVLEQKSPSVCSLMLKTPSNSIHTTYQTPRMPPTRLLSLPHPSLPTHYLTLP
jgi:hypothetical protein